MRSRNRVVLTTLLTVCLGASPSVATQIHVPEDYPTFRLGLAATAPGETLRVGPGVYDEPGGLALISPGVTVIGAGWSLPFSGTRLHNIELFFLAGSDSAVVQDLGISDRRVSSDNSLGVVRRCLFGQGIWMPFRDGYLAYVRGGLIMEGCFINCYPFEEPHTFFLIEGGNFIMRNCVFAVQVADKLMNIQDLGPYPLTLVDVRDNTFFGVGNLTFFINNSPPIPGPVNFINNIFQGDAPWFLCVNGASISREYNAFSRSPEGFCGQAGDTNMIADPMLCNPRFESVEGLEDFELHEESPCIGAGINGTTIGALGVGCGPTTAIGENAVPSLQELRINVSPNPLVRGARLVIGSEYAGATLLRLYDASGRLEVNRVLHIPSGNAVLAVDRELVMMNRGVHFLEVTQGHRRALRKIVVVP